MNLRKKTNCLSFKFKGFSALWRKGALFNIPQALLFIFFLFGFVAKAGVSDFNSSLSGDKKKPLKSFVVPDEPLDYTKISDIKLVSPYKSILKNTKKIPVGLWLSLSGGWHSYWQNPGQSARALKALWIPPEGGFSVSRLNWPLPERIKFSSFIQFVYKNSFLLTAELSTNQDTWTINRNSITLKAQADWLICREVCVPLSQQVEKTWPVVRGGLDGEEIKDPYWSAVFAKWSRLLPKTKQSVLKPKQTSNTQYQFQIRTYKKSELTDVFPLSKSRFSFEPPEILLTGGLEHSFLLSSAGRGQFDLSADGRVLAVFKSDNKRKGFIHDTAKSSLLFWFLLLAFLGGVILNFMPCVLPVVFLKFSYVLEQQKTGGIILGNLFYSAGVICSFIFLAGVLVFLKKGGQSLGWGFQMQSPYFLVGLIFLFVLISVAFMGRLPFSPPSLPFFQGGKNNFKHFLTGVLSTAVASPCTAPFMGAATGYAFSEDPFEVILVFLFLGLGLSFPYLLLSIFPKWIQYVPRPGAWNHKLKQFMAFPMLATAIWLIYMLIRQMPKQLPHLLFSLLTLALAFWLLNQKKERHFFTTSLKEREKTPCLKNSIKKICFSFFACALILCSFVYPFVSIYRGERNTQPVGISWSDFSLQKVELLRKEGKTLFINFTADWCLTCKWNERVTFKNQKVIQFFKEQNIYALKGDWTNKNPEIAAFLERYGRAGIPFYLYISPQKSVLLPELLTPSRLINRL